MRGRALVLAIATIAFAPAARAQDGLAQAKMLFAAGAAAYEKHDYRSAIRAFEGAQKLAPRAAIVFSIAQAYRHVYENTGNDQDLQSAADAYRDYIRQVPRGRRHDDAVRALEELNTRAQRATEQNAASVSINSSGTPGAHVALDDGSPVAPPLIGPVSPGKHRVVISAEGFVTERRDVTAVPGRIIAIDVPLKEKQASIRVDAPSGARVMVDGRPMGDAPLVAPLEIASGTHLLAVTENGHDAFLRELEVARGESRRVEAELPPSRQRKIAIGVLLAGATALVATGAFFSVTLVEQFQAQSLLDVRSKQGLTAPQGQSYADIRDQRNAWAEVSVATFAGAVALGLTGLLLYVFDQPSTNGAARHETEKKVNPQEHKNEPTEMAVAPLVGPTTLGLAASVRF